VCNGLAGSAEEFRNAAQSVGVGGGSGVRKLHATECKGRRNKYFEFKKRFLRSTIVDYSAKQKAIQ